MTIVILPFSSAATKRPYLAQACVKNYRKGKKQIKKPADAGF
jgi:hypothetical protein